MRNNRGKKNMLGKHSRQKPDSPDLQLVLKHNLVAAWLVNFRTKNLNKIGMNFIQYFEGSYSVRLWYPRV